MRRYQEKYRRTVTLGGNGKKGGEDGSFPRKVRIVIKVGLT